MNKAKNYAAMLVGLAIGGFGLLGAAGAEMPTNMVANGSFSDGLNSWTLENPQLSQYASIDRSIIRGSNPASLKLSAEGGKVIVLQRRVSDIKAGKFRLSGWSKCSGLSSNWEAGLSLGWYRTEFKGKSEKNPLLGQKGPYYACGQDHADWTRLSDEILDVPVAYFNAAAELCVQIFLRPIGKAVEAQAAKTGAAWFADIALEPVFENVKQAVPDKPVWIDSFYALGEQGLFSIGQPAQFLLSGISRLDRQADLEIELKVKDFFDAPITSKVVKVTVAPMQKFRHTIELESPGKYGFFGVNATVRNKDAIVASPVATFCVLREPGEKDLFFTANSCNPDRAMVKALPRIGIASKEIYLGQNDIHPDIRKQPDYLSAYIKYRVFEPDARYAPFWNSDLNLHGAIVTGTTQIPKCFHKEIEARKKAGLFPYPDAFFTEFGDLIETAARMLKSRVKVWKVCYEEFENWIYPVDNFRGIPIPSGGGICEAQRFVLMQKIAYERLKKVDPECTVASMSPGLLPELKNPHYVAVQENIKRIRFEVKDCFDIMAPDQGGGFLPKYPWPPEIGWPDIIAVSLKDAIIKTQDIQVELGKPTRNIIMAERGYAVPKHCPPNHPVGKMQANFIARSLIICKMVPGVAYYSQFTVGGSYNYGAEKGSTDAHPITDYAMWKPGCDSETNYYNLPRAAVAAFATVAGVLANVTDPEEIELNRKGCYGCLFKKNDTTVACLWTIDKKPYAVSMDLPAGTECRDLMGNSRNLPAGKNDITLSESPVFLISKADRKLMASVMQKTVFPVLPLIKCEAHLADASTLKLYLYNQTAEPQDAGIRIALGAISKTVPVPASSNTVVDLILPETSIDARLAEAVSASVRVNDQAFDVKTDAPIMPVKKISVKGFGNGDLSKYAGVKPIVLDSLAHLYPGDWESITGVQGNMQWTNVHDLSASCYLGYDEKNFYIVAEVTDDTHVQNFTKEEIWREDCIQFAFDTSNDALNPDMTGKAGFNTNDYNYGMALTADGPQIYCWQSGKNEPAGLRKFPLAIKRDGDKTVYELVIPWENLAPLAPKAGRVFGFNFVVFDSDLTAQKQDLYWMGLTPGLAGEENPSLFRKFMLMP